MTRKVYRVLDRPYTLFGLRGRYIFVFLGALGVGALISFLMGSAVGMLIGSVILVVFMILVYLAVMILESMFSEREIERFLWSRALKDFIIVKPKTFNSQWK